MLPGCGDRPEAPAGGPANPPSAATASTSSTSGSGDQPATSRPSGAGKGRGGGAPISIPDIIIREGRNVYELKKLIERSARSQCGWLCVKVRVTDVDKNELLKSYDSFPPPISAPPPGELNPGGQYVIHRGTRIVLHGNQGSDTPDEETPSSETTPGPSATTSPAAGPAPSEGGPVE